MVDIVDHAIGLPRVIHIYISHTTYHTQCFFWANKILRWFDITINFNSKLSQWDPTAMNWSQVHEGGGFQD